MIKTILLKLADKVNLLIKKTTSNPLEAITSDITELKYAGNIKKAYLCIHKDHKGQFVYGYKLSENADTNLVISSFKKCISNIQKLTKIKIQNLEKRIIFHSDQGSVYTSYEYVQTVLNYKNSILSYSTPGTPTDNAGQESFFGRFKDENYDEIKEIQTFKQLEIFINKKIWYYNHKRIHTSIGYTTPIIYTKSFLRKQKSGSVN